MNSGPAAAAAAAAGGAAAGPPHAAVPPPAEPRGAAAVVLRRGRAAAAQHAAADSVGGSSGTGAGCQGPGTRTFILRWLGSRRGPLPPIYTLPLLTVDTGPPPHLPTSAASPSTATFRYWVDFQVLNSPASAALLERALRSVGGVCTGGPTKLPKGQAKQEKCKDYGYMHMGEWDLLWSITAKAMLAAEILRPGQMVGVIPGFLCITRKTSLVRSLRTVYGDAVAFTIVPRTFKLPEELDEWAEWARQHPDEDSGLWMLKNNKQRGTGLKLVRTGDAFAACFETTKRPGLEGVMLYRWYLAQRYISSPMLINGCKFGIRVWVLVPGLNPLRAYMHANGLALFSSHKYSLADAAGSAASGARIPPGHVTNYAQNEDGQVWDLAQLAAHLGRSAFGALWADVQRSTAMVLAAAMPRVKEVQAQMSLPPHSCFQFFGLDFLVDAGCKAWLLEANATPSMKVEHADPAIERRIHQQKWPVVRDMVAMLGICPERFHTPPTKPHRDLRFMPHELQRRGGFLPLMHLFPEETPDGMRLMPWHPLDVQLRAWCRTREYQQHVSARHPACA